jgi:myotubularin-related protein 1/2
VASIVFMDIDNIHVIRHSLAKLRESLNTGSNAAADPSGAAASNSANNADGSTVHASKWTSHISSILRGAAGVADSLMLGHPVLVHCSDGW